MYKNWCVCSTIGNGYLPISTTRYRKQDAIRLAAQKNRGSYGLKYVVMPIIPRHNIFPKKLLTPSTKLGGAS